MSVPPVFLRQLFIHKSFAFAGYTFLIYDYLLTLSLEAAYIWDDPWTIVKILFLVSRYGNLIGQTFIMLEETGYLSHGSQQFCTAFELFVPCFVILTGESIRLLVSLRAFAILGCRRSVIVVWNLLYVLYAVGVLGLILYMLDHALPLHFGYVNAIGICWTQVPPNVWQILFIPLALDSSMLALVFYSLHRTARGLRGIQPSWLVRLLVRDAFLFWIAALFNSLLCMACWSIYRLEPRNNLQLFVSTPLLNVMGQRLVLNLRELRAQPEPTQDLSRELARQVAAMAMDDTESSSNLCLELNLVDRATASPGRADLHLDYDADQRCRGAPEQGTLWERESRSVGSQEA